MYEIQVTAREMRGMVVTKTSLELEEESDTKEKKTEEEVAGACVGEEGKGLWWIPPASFNLKIIYFF